MTKQRLALLWCLILLTAAGLPARAQSQGDPPSRLTLWRDGDAGTPLGLRGHVLGLDRRPVAGATVSVRHASAGGAYGSHSGEMVTDERGEWLLQTVFPGGYGRPSHIHLSVTHPEHPPVFTEVLFKGDAALGGQDPPNAIALEEVRIGERRVLVGDFEVVMGQ